MGRGVVTLAALAGLSCAAVSTTSESSSTPLPVPVSDPPIVTITASGPRPPVLHLYEPVSVTWLNQDGRPHEMNADIKTSNDSRCSMVSVGVLAPGESRKTTVLPQSLYCQYRDDARPGDTTFYGFIFSH